MQRRGDTETRGRGDYVLMKILESCPNYATPTSPIINSALPEILSRGEWLFAPTTWFIYLKIAVNFQVRSLGRSENIRYIYLILYVSTDFSVYSSLVSRKFRHNIQIRRLNGNFLNTIYMEQNPKI